MNDFYVYELRHPETEVPFYVGKGFGKRIQTYSPGRSLKGVTRATAMIIRELWLEQKEPIIHVIQDNMIEKLAFDLEEFLIQKHGRRGYTLGGLLTNVLLRGHTDTTSAGKKYKTIQFDADLKDRLLTVTHTNGWKISLVVERLVERFLNGEMSGSLADVVRND